VQEHFDPGGNKIGETRHGKDLLGEDRAEHFDADGHKIGTSYDRTDIFGDPIQEHFDSSGAKVGETRWKKDWMGSPFKEHTGRYFRTGTAEPSKSPVSRTGSQVGSAQTSPVLLKWLLLVGVLGLTIAAVPQILLWISEHLAGQESSSRIEIDRPPEWQIREDAKRVPSELRNILDEEYPGWFFPRVSAEDHRICRQPNADFLPGLVWADFDGDGMRDYGVAIQQGNNRHTLIFLARPPAFKQFILKPSGWNILGVEPKGSTLPHLEADGGSVRQGTPVTLEQDALIGIHCESSAVAFVYTDGVFRSFFISD
jgi:hypothetical protein